MFGKTLHLGAVVLFAVAPRSYAQGNPIFEIGSNPAIAHYDVLPTPIKNICTEALSSVGQTNPLSLYAYIRGGNSEYFAVWGNTPPGVEDNGFATLLSVHGNQCRASDLEIVLITVPPKDGYHGTTSSELELPGPDSPFVGVPPNRDYVFRSAREEHLTRDFIKDAIRRAVKAYGGNAQFRRAACKPQVEADLSQIAYIIPRYELKAYCAAPPARPVP